MRIYVVTGGLGFIGSHFVEMVLERDPENFVVCIDSMTYASTPSLVQEFSERFGSRFTQVTQDIYEVLDIPPCDYLVNFAAETHVDNSIESSDTFLNSNVLGVYNLLEILRKKEYVGGSKCPVFCQVSTDEVFGDQVSGSSREDQVHSPKNPYSALKSAAEQLVVAWGNTYGVPYVITRSANNYGIRQYPEKLVPVAISRILDGKKIPVYGDGTARRTLIHVEDHVRAILLILDSGSLNSSYNIGTDDELSITDIVTTIATAMGQTFSEVTDKSRDRPGMDMRYSLNSDKIRAMGWSPQRTFKGSLSDLIQFYSLRRRS